jgi:hypothetical protein
MRLDQALKQKMAQVIQIYARTKSARSRICAKFSATDLMRVAATEAATPTGWFSQDRNECSYQKYSPG